MSKFQQFFDDADKDRSGYLSYDELCAVLKKNGYREEKIQDTFATLDTSGDNKISRDEFLSAMDGRHDNEHKAAQFRAVCRSFDKNSDGTISAQELRDGLKSCKINLSDAELKRVMTKLDKDGSGTVSYEELLQELFGQHA